MWGAILGFLDKAKRWVRYGYFLRFSLALWLFAPLLCVLDTTGFKTLTSGVMTPETLQQYICVAFFLVSAGFVALICARVVLINGPERWDKCYDQKARDAKRTMAAHPASPPCLPTTQAKNEWWALLLSQLPNVGVYWYLIVNGSGQEVHATDIWLGLILGSVLAVIVWWVVNACYYLTYSAPDPTGDRRVRQKRRQDPTHASQLPGLRSQPARHRSILSTTPSRAPPPGSKAASSTLPSSGSPNASMQQPPATHID